MEQQTGSKLGKEYIKAICSPCFSSVQLSCTVVSDSLRPHESQQARPPCPPPTPGVHSDSLNFYSEYIMWNASLDESQAGIKTAGANINNLRYTDDNNSMAENEEKLESILMKVKEESEKLA